MKLPHPWYHNLITFSLGYTTYFVEGSPKGSYEELWCSACNKIYRVEAKKPKIEVVWLK